MVQRQVPQAVAERRCPNCGTRVARDAEICFMCGYDLRIKPRRKQRISWIDALLVLAVIAVLVFWWKIGGPSDLDPVVQSEEALPSITIPTLAPSATPTQTPEPTPTITPSPPEEILFTHEVRQDENLLAIAGFYGVTVEQIQAANNLDGVLIRVGDKLQIPIMRSARQSEEPVSEEFNYRVVAGDTINSIAISFGARIDDILNANSLSANEIIRPGDILLVPVRNVPLDVTQSSEDGSAGSSQELQFNASEAESAERIYIEPRLIGPPNEATVTREESVLLSWASVDILAPNEWYVLQIQPVDGATASIPQIWTKTTSYRFDVEFAPDAGSFARYAWQVSVIRLKPSSDNRQELEPISPASAARLFTWQ